MKLHEYQSKQIFARYGIPIPKGKVAATASEARMIADELGSRVVIKSQVLVGGRGKAGGIRLAKNALEAEALAGQILSMEIKGLPVRKVLVDEAASIDHEIYFGITNDRAARKPVMMASSAGGVEIEEVARTNTGKNHQGAHRSLVGAKRLPDQGYCCRHRFTARNIGVRSGPSPEAYGRHTWIAMPPWQR